MKEYGIINGMTVTEYEMVNCNDMTVCVLDYGCIIKNILVNDKSGNKTDVVLGQDISVRQSDVIQTDLPTVL